MNYVNISSVQDFSQCRYRWWAKWIRNRVPRDTAPALDGGKILHRAFELYFAKGVALDAALKAECLRYRISMQEAGSPPGWAKAVEPMEDLIEAMPLWRDQFKIDDVLEVEKPFEWLQPNNHERTWRGRPDRVIVIGGRIWHMQNRGLAPGMNFGTYCRLAKRHYHEHLYPHPIMERYKKKKLKYGGTLFNLVRKLKFRTYAGKKNEKVKTAEEMFFQHAMSVSLTNQLHRDVIETIFDHADQMEELAYRCNKYTKYTPAPNDKMNGGFGGNIEDPYFRVLIGEISLDDDTVFKDREDTYETSEVTE